MGFPHPTSNQGPIVVHCGGVVVLRCYFQLSQILKSDVVGQCRFVGCGLIIPLSARIPTRAGFGAPGSNGILSFPPLCPILCINPTSRIHSTLQKNSVEYRRNFWYKRLSFTREIQEQVTNPNLCPNIIIVLSFLYFMYILKIDKMSYDSQVFKM